MKKLAILALLAAVAACHRSTTQGAPRPSAGAGAATPRDAIARFMASARTQDLQAMSLIWGSPEGPIRDTRAREEVEQREAILMCYLKHDSYRIVNEAPGASSERVMGVELQFRDLTRLANFTVGQGPSDRWYVFRFDIDPLRDICARR